MKFDYVSTARVMHHQFIRHAWATPQRRWTVSFVILGLILALAIMPGIGIAVFGTAFAGWWLGVALVMLITGLIGNRVGVGREKAAAERRAREGRTM